MCHYLFLVQTLQEEERYLISEIKKIQQSINKHFENSKNDDGEKRYKEILNEQKYLVSMLEKDRIKIIEDVSSLVQKKEKLSMQLFDMEVEIEYKDGIIEYLKKQSELINATSLEKENILKFISSKLNLDMDGEQLIYQCSSFYKNMLGNLYITKNYLCWIGNLSSIHDTYLNISDIKRLEKVWHMFVKSIKVYTDNINYTFSGIWRRGYVYKEIQKRMDYLKLNN